jgi:hypothetical protein
MDRLSHFYVRPEHRHTSGLRHTMCYPDSMHISCLISVPLHRYTQTFSLCKVASIQSLRLWKWILGRAWLGPVQLQHISRRTWWQPASLPLRYSWRSLSCITFPLMVSHSHSPLSSLIIFINRQLHDLLFKIVIPKVSQTFEILLDLPFECLQEHGIRVPIPLLLANIMAKSPPETRTHEIWFPFQR